MNAVPKLALSHVGFHVTDIAKMRDFYTRVLGFTVTDEGTINNGAMEMVFMSRDPRDHHQVVIATGRAKDTPTIVNQLSFRAESIADLRNIWQAAKAEGARNVDPVDHGVAWSVYFLDPEDNRVEVFVDTPWYVKQPRRQSLDLAQPDDGVRQTTLDRIKGEPTFGPIEAWRAEIAKKIEARAG